MHGGMNPLSLLYHTRREKKMNERMKLALDLLRLKAARQMCEGKTTCTLDENDVQDVLFIAGMGLDDKQKELEVIA
jgi:hypothetical protein